MSKDEIKVPQFGKGGSQTFGGSTIQNSEFAGPKGSPTGSAPAGGPNNIKDVAYNMPRKADKISAAPDKVPNLTKDDIKVV